MELRHLRYFTVVAEERHFGRAAKRLQIAQPPLSRQIHALEAELGLRLFDRTRRGVVLTAPGAALLARSQAVFEALDQAITAAHRAQAGELGRVVIGYVASLAYVGIADVLRAFRAAQPEVELVVRELSPQEQLASLKDGRIDLGFVRGPVTDAGLTTAVARREPLVVALPHGHRLARRARIEVAQLAAEPFVIAPRERGPAYFDLLMSLCRSAGFAPRIVQEAPQLDLVSLVAAGFGVAIVPESLRKMGRPGLVLRPLVGAPHTELLIVWRATDGSPALARFLELARRALK